MDLNIPGIDLTTLCKTLYSLRRASHIISMGLGIGNSFTGWVGLAWGCFLRLQSRCQPGLWSPEGWTGAGRSTSEVLRKLVLAGGLSFSPP